MKSLNVSAFYECPEYDERDERPSGVLLSNEIEHYVNICKMIDPFSPENLKPAAYELTVGDQYSIGGKKPLSLAEGEKIEIPPFQVASQDCDLTFLVSFSMISELSGHTRPPVGRRSSGRPRVVGPLSCPIYNLSSKEVKIQRGEAIAVIDFVTTTPFFKGKSRAYEYRPPKRLLFEDYNTELQSALFTEAGQKVSAIEKRMSEIESRMRSFLGVVLTIITILFAVLAVFVSSTAHERFLGVVLVCCGLDCWVISMRIA